MPHEVESMFYVGEVPWHKLGKSFDPKVNLSVEEAINAADLNWWVDQRKLKTTDGYPVHGYNANFRHSDNSLLGVAGDQYQVVQNIEAFRWFEPFIQGNLARFECAGSLRGGRIVWILAKLQRKNSTIRPEDEILKYLLLANSHDGSITLRLGLTPVRVVCMNTLSASLSKGDHIISLKHKRNVFKNMEDVQTMVARIDDQFERVADGFRMLAEIDIKTEQLESYVRGCFGLAHEEQQEKVPQPEEETEEEKSRLVEKITEIFEVREYGSSAFNTWWEAYNAVCEYLSHIRGRSLDGRLNSVWFGNSEMVNRRALHLALKLAAQKRS